MRRSAGCSDVLRPACFLAEATLQSYKCGGGPAKSGLTTPTSTRINMSEVSSSAATVSVRIPAKINICLGVGPRRADGFHELATIFQALDLYDTVTARRVGSPNAPATLPTLRLSGPESTGLAADHTNLAWRAAEGLRRRAGGEEAWPMGFELLVHKEIPVAAGLAGGSADGAGALVACDALWRAETSVAALEALAADLGSDVTFALHGGTALGTGRGETLRTLPTAGDWHWVVAAAAGQLSTPAVYAELDRQRAAGLAAGSAFECLPAATAALAAGDPHALAASMANDLEPAALALAPELQKTLDAGSAAGALASIVSGSGPTCVFLVADREQAEAVSAALITSRTCRFARPARGHVPGALGNLGVPSHVTDLASAQRTQPNTPERS
jgi:4-diphosphocytidyl-2-C-methyl-D-erythritol kinase